MLIDNCHFWKCVPCAPLIIPYSVTSDERVAGVVKWLNLPSSEKPYFIATYFDVVDSMGRILLVWHFGGAFQSNRHSSVA